MIYFTDSNQDVWDAFQFMLYVDSDLNKSFDIDNVSIEWLKQRYANYIQEYYDYIKNDYIPANDIHIDWDSIKNVFITVFKIMRSQSAI